MVRSIQSMSFVKFHAIPNVLTPGFDLADAEDHFTTRRPDMDKPNGIIP